MWHKNTQQNSYSIISVTYQAQWLDSDDVVTDDNSQQHSDYTVDQL